MGGGILANHTNKKKGFAISGILYPLLILTLFLVVQMLFMLQTRKNVLDKARTELADNINTSNEIYTNEELSTLIQEQQKKISELQTNYAKLVTKDELNQSSQNILNHANDKLNKRVADKLESTISFSCGDDNVGVRQMIASSWNSFDIGFSAKRMNSYGCWFMALVNKEDDNYGTVILTGYSGTTLYLGDNSNKVWKWYRFASVAY